MLARFDPQADGVLRVAHCLTVDSRGDIYVGEISTGRPAIQKFARLS